MKENDSLPGMESGRGGGKMKEPLYNLKLSSTAIYTGKKRHRFKNFDEILHLKLTCHTTGGGKAEKFNDE